MGRIIQQILHVVHQDIKQMSKLGKTKKLKQSGGPKEKEIPRSETGGQEEDKEESPEPNANMDLEKGEDGNQDELNSNPDIKRDLSQKK